MPDYLIGTELILKALLDHGKCDREKRPYHERYNLIMDAIYGYDAGEFYIQHEPGRLPMKSTTGLGLETILIQMYERDPDEKIDREVLARDFIHLLDSKATDKSRAQTLARHYRKRRDWLKSDENRRIAKEIARIQIEDGGFAGVHAEGVDDIAKVLRYWDWPV